MRRALVIAAMAVFAGFGAGRAEFAQQGGYSISGVVVNAITGAPLDRAEVTLTTDGEDGTQIGQGVTGEGGEFHFDGLSAGKYALQASRRGFLSAGYQEHEGGYFTAVVTGANLASRGLRFPLTPYGAISGTVNDDNGNPVADAQVTLFRQDMSNGEMKVEEAENDTTDDAGGYEFARLKPGTYYVDVSAQPWFAFRRNRVADLSGNGGADEQPPSPLDVAYPLTFFPNAADSSGASPLTLNAGDRVQANFSLHSVQAIHVEVRVPMGDARRGIEAPQLAQEVFGTQQNAGEAIPTFDRKAGVMTFDYGSLAPGHYELEQGSHGAVPMDATSNRTLDAPSAVAATVEVSGKFAMASGGPLPEHLGAWLERTNGISARVSSTVARDGSFNFSGVSAGTYGVNLGGTSGAVSVLQMAASGGEVHGNQITVASDPVLLAATVAVGAATVNGFAQRDGKGMGGMLILLVPADANASGELIRRDQSDSDGSFTLHNVVPGSYVLLAIENGWGLEWAKRDAVAPYLARGLKVQVAENQKTVNLPSAVGVQKR